MNKSAKELFEELGYRLFEKTKSKSYIRYFKGSYNGYYGDYISFDLKNKRFRLTTKTTQGNISFMYGTMQELKAINQMCKELGWFDE